MEVNENPIHSKPKNHLNTEQRQALIEFLLQQCKERKLKKNAIATAATTFSVSTRTVSRLWKQAQLYLGTGSVADVFGRRCGKVGRKRKQINPSDVRRIPLRRRTNIRSLSIALHMARSTVHRRIKEGLMRPHSNALKPLIGDETKKKRMLFCLSMLNIGAGNGNVTFNFNDMHNYIHVDEKWFYLSRKSQKYYLLPEEEDSYRSCRSTTFITKVMFLAAVARPRFNTDGSTLFSGKIGIFPFTLKVPAKRSSKNRVAGTLETKAIHSVTKDVYKAWLIEKLLPAIQSSWPRDSTLTTILIQQDNAKPHLNPDDADFIQAVERTGLDIRLSFQPPNSPDFNVLDLGFFNAIQSLQYQEAPSSIDELVAAVEKSFNQLSPQALDDVFVTLQLCMKKVMRAYGSNSYKIPHIGKQRFHRNGSTSIQFNVSKV